MDVTRHRYAVEGWGVGEIAVRGEVLVEHVLPVAQAPATRRGGRAPQGREHP